MKFAELKSQIDDQNSGYGDSKLNKVKNLEAILDVVKSINSTLIMDNVLEVVLKNAIKISETERGFIVLKNSEDKLEYKLGMDRLGNNLSESMFQISTTVVQDVFFNGQSKFIEGAQSDSNLDSSKSILNLELQTILCSPLLTEDKKIGVIYVDSTHIHKIKDQNITDTFEVLAGQAATAIRNAQLYDGQISAYNALNEANIQLIQAERKTLKSSLDSEIGHELQGLVHMALLEIESLYRQIEKSEKDTEVEDIGKKSILFDRLKLKSKVAIDSIRTIQRYAHALLESSALTLNTESGDLNETIESVIRYSSAMRKFLKITFKSDFNKIPIFRYDSEQIEHLLVHLFSNSAEAKADAIINIKTYAEGSFIKLIVADNGPGISDTLKNNLFKLPTQMNPGYGLFLCKSIMERHGGSIELVDTEIGTKMEITFINS
ncbi:MAG: hypothetical protein COW08_06110 [Ignavibacteriales bacterium CG12_big_fil_rev_8_21_14_0_65_30_8]|nr:MAG: hypothetical protein COW08_06110 [Ignavibacteriales bacterium CG12_big_fil_rev_8_21_14_0_65_30_8]